MTELEHVRKDVELVDPRTGEILDPRDYSRLSDLVTYLREAKRSLQAAINNVQDAILVEAERQGTKTLHLEDGRVARISGGTEPSWDVEILHELLAAGLPEERFNALVTQIVSYKVSAALAKQIAAANPKYAEIVERAESRVEKPMYVSVGK